MSEPIHFLDVDLKPGQKIGDFVKTWVEDRTNKSPELQAKLDAFCEAYLAGEKLTHRNPGGWIDAGPIWDGLDAQLDAEGYEGTDFLLNNLLPPYLDEKNKQKSEGRGA